MSSGMPQASCSAANRFAGRAVETGPAPDRDHKAGFGRRQGVEAALAGEPGRLLTRLLPPGGPMEIDYDQGGYVSNGRRRSGTSDRYCFGSRRYTVVERWSRSVA